MKKIKSFLAGLCLNACLVLIIIRPFYPQINHGGYLNNVLLLFEVLTWGFCFLSICMAISYSSLPEDIEKKEKVIKSAKLTLEKSKNNIAASFQKAAVDILMRRVRRALKDTGLTRVVAGGGVVANSLLRKELLELDNIETIIPSMSLCTDNGAMIAGIGFHYLERGMTSDYSMNASARVQAFRKKYP